MSLLEQRLNKEWADEVLKEEKRLITAIIYDLQETGKAIASELEFKNYDSMEELLLDHATGKTPLDVLEGGSDSEEGLLVLRQCPMTKIVSSMLVDGKLPDFYARIVQKYTEMHKNKGAILHPFCIVHQVIRGMVGEHIKVGGKSLKVYQVACRSMTSGKIVYAKEGTERIKLTQEDIDIKIEGKACMYLIKG